MDSVPALSLWMLERWRMIKMVPTNVVTIAHSTPSRGADSMVINQVSQCGFQPVARKTMAMTQATRLPTIAPTMEEREMYFDFFATPR